MKKLIGTYRNEIILTGFWLLIILLINPLGNFPLNDDWAYSKSVKTLHDSSILKIYNWGEMTLVGHVYWGYLFTSLFGFSFTVLRWSILVLGLVTSIGLLQLFLEVKINKQIALICSLIILANPIFMSLSFSYMTDISFFCTTVWCTYYFFKSINGNYTPLLFASLLVIISYTIRQLAIIYPFIWLITILLSKKWNKANVIKAVFPLLIACVFIFLFNAIMDYYDVFPERYNSKLKLLFNKVLNINKTLIVYVTLNFVQLISYLGLFLLPVILIFGRELKSKLNYVVIFVWTLVAFLLLYRYQKMLPSFHNVWIDFGVGPTTLIDDTVSFIKAPLPRPSSLFWMVITTIGLFFGGLILLKLKTAVILISKKYKYDEAKLFAIVFIIIYSLPFLIVGFYDRYLLPIFPMVIVLLASSSALKFTLIKKAVVYSFVSILLLFSVCAIHDYMSWNRVRWQLISDLENDGISKNKIQGGTEFVTWNFFSETEKEWWKSVKPVYQLKFHPNSNDHILVAQNYSRWLPGEGKLYVVYNKELE